MPYSQDQRSPWMPATNSSRTVLLVANGMSVASPDLYSVPADVDIVRMPWFFLESTYAFGDRVDAVFSPHRDTYHEELLAEAIRRRDYRVEAFGTANRPNTNRKGAYGYDHFAPIGLKSFSVLEAIASRPSLALALMSAPEGRPTTQLQAIAWAMAVGYRKVLLAGFDRMAAGHSGQVYGRSTAHEIALSLTTAESVDGFGLSDDQAFDADSAYLRTIQEEFPETELLRITPAQGMLDSVPTAPAVDDPLATDPNRRIGAFKPRFTAHQGTARAIHRSADDVHFQVDGDVIPEPWTEIDGKRCAYITLVTGDYHYGARVLHNSLREMSSVPLIAMCGPGADVAMLQQHGIATIDVPEIMNRHSNYAKNQDRFAATFTKLNAFALDFLDRAIFLDSDTVVLQNLDELFARDGFAAAGDNGFDLDLPYFNSGVFAYTPSRSVFEAMLGAIPHTESSDGGDQGFLNNFFAANWERLPREYNTTKRVFLEHPEIFDLERVKVLHYVGVKPWELSRGHRQYAEINDIWFDHLDPVTAVALVRAWSRQQADLDKDRGTPGTGGADTRPRAGAASVPAKSHNARRLLADGDVEAAIRESKRVLSDTPTSVKAEKTLRDAYFTKQDYPRTALYAARAVAKTVRNRITR